MSVALLLSGGMDSTAIAHWKRPDLAITIDYGQGPAPGEARAARAVCGALGMEHHIIRADLSALGSGDLAGRPPVPNAPASEWWPYRNQMLLTIAAMYGAGRGVTKLLIGALRTDGFHIDGTKQFVAAFDALTALQEGQVRVEAPAIELSAEELIMMSCVPMSLLAWAHSCHVSEFACGWCGGCRKHYQTLERLGHAPY